MEAVLASRSYPRRHPFALSYAIGAALTGIAYIVQISTGAEFNPVLAIQSDFAQYVWAATYLIGGVFCTYGIVKEYPPAESAGFTMLAAAILISVVANLFSIFNYVSLISGGSIAFGAGLRAYLLSRNRL